MKIRTAGLILFSSACALAVFIACNQASASDPGGGDWPRGGGTADRNMVSNQKGMPTSWDVKIKKNVKWVSTLGSQSYGNPVIAGGQVYVGPKNEGLVDPKQDAHRGA